MDPTPEQEQAVDEARQILVDAGVDLNLTLSTKEFLAAVQQNEASTGPLPAVNDCDLTYQPPPANYFTDEQIENQENKLTRQATVDAWIDHPIGVIVEFLESGALPELAVAHRFRVNPEGFIHPKDNLQYSLGDSKGGHKNVVCHLLKDASTGKSVACYQTKISCRSEKKCHFGLKEQGDARGLNGSRDSRDARQEVFEKTLALYTSIISKGCTLAGEFFPVTRAPGPKSYEDEEIDLPYDIRATIPPSCKGKFILAYDSNNRPILKCEHHKRGQRAHLFMRNLGEYDLTYLRALLEKDEGSTWEIEEAARSCGYGPLVPCGFVAMRREQKQLCPHWHRFPDFSLKRGILQPSDCPTRFEIYVPNELQKCLEILIVSRNPHSHPNPRPTKTPHTIISIFNSFLRELGWRLADATPRRLVLDAGFMGLLRKRLSWDEVKDPTLADFHPSLGNLDHTACLINNMRDEFFPCGTGFQGAIDLWEKHKKLPQREQYVRVVETVELPGQDPFKVIICMLPAMSEMLMATTRPTIDTAFKRADGYEELEIEAWFPEAMKSIVCARAFITSQTAAAHLYFFNLIFKIAEEDTGKRLQFKYADGTGIETIGTDAHKGAALGLGQFVASRCQNSTQICCYPCQCIIATLTPYEHLAHFLRLCTNHFECGIQKLGNRISPEVRAAMYSISTAYPLPNFKATLDLIRDGGEKALAWLNDKEVGSPFVIPAIYQPASKIPLEVWQAAPATTNGNEQAHRNVNRDGIKLTLLAALWRGHQYDVRAISSVNLSIEVGIHPHDQQQTHFWRVGRALIRNVRVQKRKLAAIDQTLEDTCAQIDRLRGSARAPVAILANPKSTGNSRETAIRNLEKLDARFKSLQRSAELLATKGSGATPASARVFSQEPSLFNHELISGQMQPLHHYIDSKEGIKYASASQGPSRQDFVHNSYPHYSHPLLIPGNENKPQVAFSGGNYAGVAEGSSSLQIKQEQMDEGFLSYSHFNSLHQWM